MLSGWLTISHQHGKLKLRNLMVKFVLLYTHTDAHTHAHAHTQREGEDKGIDGYRGGCAAPLPCRPPPSFCGNQCIFHFFCFPADSIPLLPFPLSCSLDVSPLFHFFFYCRYFPVLFFASFLFFFHHVICISWFFTLNTFSVLLCIFLKTNIQLYYFIFYLCCWLIWNYNVYKKKYLP